jgi:hypothetical protein
LVYPARTGKLTKQNVSRYFRHLSPGQESREKMMKKLAVIVGLLLLGFLPYAVATAAVSVRLSPEEAAGISGETRGGKSPLELRQRVGIVRSVSHQVDFHGFRAGDLPAAPTPAARGMLAAHPGGMTWAAAVDAVDATALGLHFTAFKLPANAQLYIFNEKGQVDGPYTDTGSRGNGNFWSHTIRGSLAYVQVQFDGQPSDEDLRGSHFVIADVAHIGPLYQVIEIWNTCRSIDEGCVRLIIDPTISANSANSAVDNARLAIAHMQFASGGSIYICSGGLLADTDTDPNSERNYFLTANHCISKPGEANSLETVFLYTDCEMGMAPPTTLGVGAQILSGSRNSDFTLLELDGEVPSGTRRLG